MSVALGLRDQRSRPGFIDHVKHRGVRKILHMILDCHRWNGGHQHSGLLGQVTQGCLVAHKGTTSTVGFHEWRKFFRPVGAVDHGHLCHPEASQGPQYWPGGTATADDSGVSAHQTSAGAQLSKSTKYPIHIGVVCPPPGMNSLTNADQRIGGSNALSTVGAFSGKVQRGELCRHGHRETPVAVIQGTDEFWQLFSDALKSPIAPVLQPCGAVTGVMQQRRAGMPNRASQHCRAVCDCSVHVPHLPSLALEH